MHANPGTDFKIINNISMKLVGGRYSEEIVRQELDFVEGFVGSFVGPGACVVMTIDD